MGQENRKKEVVEEYLAGGVSLRELSRKCGLKHATLHRWVKAHQGGQEIEKRLPQAIKAMPKGVGRLQRELYEARRTVKLYETMIEVAEKELGVPIRKRSGAR